MKTIVCISLIFVALIVSLALTSAIAESQAGILKEPMAPPEPGFPVKPAIIVPLSGPVQGYGERTRDGALVAIQQAQAAGWDIQTVFADSQCDTQAAITAANQVIFTDSVKYIMGAVCSSASIPISEIAEANQVLQISPTSTNPQVTVHGDGTNKEYVFRACFLDPFQGYVMAAVASDLGAATAAIMYDEGNGYVAGLAQSFKSNFEDMGGSVPAYEAYTQDTHDFSEILGRVATADPDVLFLPDYYGRVNEIAEQANTIGILARFLGGDGWDSPDLRLDLLEGAYFSTHFWPQDPRQIVVDFVEAYSTTYGTRPDALAALGYDATGVLLQAIAEAGVDDATAVKDKMADIVYEGVTGKIVFNEFGDPIKGAAIVKIEDEQTTFVKFVAPVSNLVAMNDSPTNLGETTTLTATVMTGSDVTYTWTLGDETVTSGQVVTHTYGTAGVFTAIVTASNRMNTITATTTVTINAGTNTPPTLSDLPNQAFDESTSLPGTIDLWAYASDSETPVSDLNYTIDNALPSGAGVTLGSNRYVTVNPSATWCGGTDVTIRVTDSGGLWATDTFRVSVSWSCLGPIELPGAPALVAPADGSASANSTPTFVWNAAAGADTYQIQVDDNPDFGSPAREYTTAGTDYTPMSDIGGGIFYWHVRASNGLGTGEWSAKWEFTAPPSASVGIRVYLPAVTRAYP